jgi:hypothetical protein
MVETAASGVKYQPLGNQPCSENFQLLEKKKPKIQMSLRSQGGS